MLVPLDFLVCSFGLSLVVRGAPSASLAEPDLDDEGLLIWSESIVDFVHDGKGSATASGIDEMGLSLRSEAGAMVVNEINLRQREPNVGRCDYEEKR